MKQNGFPLDFLQTSTKIMAFTGSSLRFSKNSLQIQSPPLDFRWNSFKRQSSFLRFPLESYFKKTRGWSVLFQVPCRILSKSMISWDPPFDVLYDSRKLNVIPLDFISRFLLKQRNSRIPSQISFRIFFNYRVPPLNFLQNPFF